MKAALKDARIRRSVPGDKEALYEIWQACFGDEVSFIDRFFDCFGGSGIALVAECGGKAAAAVYPLPAGTVSAFDKVLSCQCLYAVSTLPSFTGRGFATALLEEAAARAFEEGIDCVYLNPASPGLFSFYEQRGFVPCFYSEEAVCRGPFGTSEVELEPIGVSEYHDLREKLLEKQTHMRYQSDMISFQKMICRADGGDLYRFRGGAAAVEILDENNAYVKELLCGPEFLKSSLNAIGNQYGLNTVRYRCPVSKEGGAVMGLARFKDGDPLIRGAYAPFDFG